MMAFFKILIWQKFSESWECDFNFKDAVEETQSDKSKILATQKVMITCFSSSMARTLGVDIVSEVVPEFMLIKVTKI